MKLLRTEQSQGSVDELSLLGKLESLKNKTPNFECLCQSNLAAVRRFCYRHQHINVIMGMWVSYYAGKLDIFDYLVSKGDGVSCRIVADAIANGNIKVLQNLTRRRFDKLKLCYDWNNIFVDDGDDTVCLKNTMVNDIEHVVKYGAKVCQCKNPNNHGMRGPSGPNGNCSRSSYRPVSRYQDKLKNRTWIKKKKKIDFFGLKPTCQIRYSWLNSNICGLAQRNFR